MDALLEKDLAIIALKLDALNQRGELVLALSQLINEYHILVVNQQHIIKKLTKQLKEHENESADPAGKSVQGTPPAAS